MRGWHSESYRHYLAAKGIKTSHKLAGHHFDFTKLHHIGEGSDRLVFAKNRQEVVKVAKTPRGLMQNEYEGKSELTPKVYERGKDYVIVQKVVPLEEQKVEDLLEPLDKYGQEDFLSGDPKLHEKMKKLGIDALWGRKDIAFGDVKKPSSWALDKNGKLVLVDAGTLTLKSAGEHSKFNRRHPEYVHRWKEVMESRKELAHEEKLAQ